MSSEIKNGPIQRESPEGKRWVVISYAEIAARALKQRSIKPTPETITTLIRKAKSDSRTWEILSQKAKALRESEFSSFFSGGSAEAKKEALCFLGRKYAEIDGDKERNCNYLDDIVLGNGMDQSQETTP